MTIRLLVLVAVIGAAVACGPRTPALRIATTTSVDNSGLLEALLPAFERAHRIDVRALAVGSGQAFQIARRGDAALLLTHDPAGERALVTEGLVRYYRKVMFNQFVIAGPASDPAGIRHASSASEAMSRLARSEAIFVSRGDESGTHAREQALWRLAGVSPPPARRPETGQGMAATLRVASHRQAYVLTDEATFAQLEHRLSLQVLVSGDPVLVNTYAVAILNTAPPDKLPMAEAFAAWIAEGEGQASLDAFRVNGRPVFFRWPEGRPHGRPESLPEAQAPPPAATGAR